MSAVRSKTCRAASATRSSTSSAVTSTTSRRWADGSAGSTICHDPSSSTANTVRRLSCRSSTSPIARPSAARSTGPDSRSAVGTLYVAEGPSNWCRNHSRCCAGDSGTRRGRSRATSGVRAAAAPSSTPESPAMVGVSKNCRTDSSTPSAVLIRLTSRLASSECPPRSKKPSSMPTRATPSTSAKSAQRISSRGPRGPRPAGSPSYSGAGSALRSSFPFGVNGSASSVTNAVGTMNSGSRPHSRSRSSRTSGAGPAGTTYATSRRSPGRSSRIVTTVSATDGCRTSSASISPSSMRKPRSLTCWSTRLRYRSAPSLRRHTRSPVRYIRAPAGPYGSAVNRSDVSEGRRW